MSIPQKTREYRLPKLKATEVLVKVHAVSFNYRDLVIAQGKYMARHKENVVPGSDLAGEIVALGTEVTGWSTGDRVSSNFAIGHVFGDVTEEAKATALGAPINGVLTEYKVLPVYALVRIPEQLSYEQASSLSHMCRVGAASHVRRLTGRVVGARRFTHTTRSSGRARSRAATSCSSSAPAASVFGLQLAVASGATVIQTNDRGVDHIFEVGGPGTIMKSANAIRYGGTISIIEFIAGVRTSVAPPHTSRCRWKPPVRRR
ncbi:Zinc-type alcohol dehydrogenase-like protein [Trametes pubescens]|uniref:Zinc-type alcohol dehydrogenase-like protein n=1 Tax=Trametes pubescens TaxID=154538 RepID=A0A1M2V502_TRAPU|nr:Zinc-type alcohol dehydrogenase-like protein [Trametes pubescens]